MRKFFLLLAMIAATILTTHAQVPTATIGGTYTVCADDPVSIPIHLTNGPIWDITIQEDFTGNTFTVRGITANPYTLEVSPATTRTYSIVSVSNRTSESVSGNGTATVVIHERPLEFPIICDFPFICQGKTSGEIVLPSSESDVMYQLFRYGELYPENEVMGNGTSISFPGQTEPGIYYILARKQNGCPSILGTITLEVLF
jgi:hypothetical protein